MSIFVLKSAFQMLLRPLAGRLAAAGVTANQVSVVAALGSLAVGAFVAVMSPAHWPFLFVPIWLFIRMALNAIDGMLARDYGQKSKLGAYLNELGDVVSDAALYAPFALLPAFGGFWIAVVIVLSALTELAGVLGQTIGASRRYDGPMGKSDRAARLRRARPLGRDRRSAARTGRSGCMVALAVLLLVTVDNRVRAGLREAQAEIMIEAFVAEPRSRSSPVPSLPSGRNGARTCPICGRASISPTTPATAISCWSGRCCRSRVREKTRPVAGADYWLKDPVRRYHRHARVQGRAGRARGREPHRRPDPADGGGARRKAPR